MAIPSAVQRAADSAEEQLNKMFPGTAQADEAEEPDTDTGSDSADPWAEGQAETESEYTEHETEARPQTDDWAQKYRVLQGKYNAEVPRLAEDNRRLHERIQQLQAQFDELVQQAPQRTQEAAESGPDLFEGLEDEYPQDLIQVLRTLKQQNEELTAQLRQVQGQTARASNDSFQSRLDAMVPEWRTLNTDKGFLQWLQKPEPYSGTPLQQFLNTAVQRGDVQAVAKFFTDFQARSGARKKIADDREKLIEPGSARSSGANPKPKLDDRQRFSALDEMKQRAAKGRLSDKEMDGYLERLLSPA